MFSPSPPRPGPRTRCPLHSRCAWLSRHDGHRPTPPAVWRARKLLNTLSQTGRPSILYIHVVQLYMYVLALRVYLCDVWNLFPPYHIPYCSGMHLTMCCVSAGIIHHSSNNLHTCNTHIHSLRHKYFPTYTCTRVCVLHKFMVLISFPYTHTPFPYLHAPILFVCVYEWYPCCELQHMESAGVKVRIVLVPWDGCLLILWSLGTQVPHRVTCNRCGGGMREVRNGRTARVYTSHPPPSSLLPSLLPSRFLPPSLPPPLLLSFCLFPPSTPSSSSSPPLLLHLTLPPSLSPFPSPSPSPSSSPSPSLSTHLQY